MKIATMTIVKVIDNATQEEICSADGGSANVIVPAVGSFIRTDICKQLGKTEHLLLRVTAVVHIFSNDYRNAIEVFVDRVSTPENEK